jgi:hypothetical protein
MEALSDLRDKPAGTIRITAGEHAVNMVLRPRLDTFLPESPDIEDIGLLINVVHTLNSGQCYDAKNHVCVRRWQSINKPLSGREKGPVRCTPLRGNIGASLLVMLPQRRRRAMSEAIATTDHSAIRKWVEARKGTPAVVRTAGKGGILRIDFGEPEDTLEPIEWDEFFQIFEGNHLAFLYQDKTADGGKSRFNKFVERSADHRRPSPA